MGTSKLGNMLVEDGLLSESDRRTIKRTCGTGGSAFARGILAMGLLDEDELAAYIAEHTSWKVAAKNLLESVQSGAWGCIDRPLIEQLEVLPIRLAGDKLHVAMIDPLDLDSISQLEFFSGYKILPIIATMTQVRTGLLKFLPDYQAANSQLEDFLKNHSLTASTRVRMADESIYDDHPTPDSFSISGFDEPAKNSSEKMNLPASDYSQNDFDGSSEDDIEFSTSDNMDIEEINDSDDSGVELSMQGKEAPSSDDDDLFSIDEESFSESGGEPNPKVNIAIDAFGSEDIDSIFDDPLPDPDVDLQASAELKSQQSEGEDLDNLMDLSDFDVDKSVTDDELNMDFEITQKTAEKNLAPAVDENSLEPSDVLEDTLGDDLGVDLSEELSNDIDSGISGTVSELGGNSEDLFAESDNLKVDLSSDFEESATKDETDFFESSTDADNQLNADLSRELSANFSSLTVEDNDDLDLENFSDSKDDLTLNAQDESDLSLDLGEENTVNQPITDEAEINFNSESTAEDFSETRRDNLPTLETHPQDLSMNINKMFFHVSMANETKSAIGAIASDLKATGFCTGMIIGGTANNQFRPECGWLDSTSGNQQATTAIALQDKGIAAALGRLPSAWTPLDDAVRGGDLKIFASLQRENKKLYGIKFSDSKDKRDTVIITAITAEISENEGLMQMASDLFKQVATKNKTAA